MLFTGARLAVKRSTGLVGLSVNPNARQTLTELYRRTLDEVKVRGSVRRSLRRSAPPAVAVPRTRRCAIQG